MKKHTVAYMRFFGYSPGDYIPCEIPNCYNPANDIHHINCRGMGGNPKKDKDKVENLMGICRPHHDEYGDKTEHKPMLKEVHANFMKQFGK